MIALAVMLKITYKNLDLLHTKSSCVCMCLCVCVWYFILFIFNRYMKMLKNITELVICNLWICQVVKNLLKQGSL